MLNLVADASAGNAAKSFAFCDCCCCCRCRRSCWSRFGGHVEGAEVSVSTVVNTAGGPKVRICRFQDCEETWVQSSICFMTVITITDSHADDSLYKL